MSTTPHAYLIGNFTVTDPALMAEYGKQARPLVEQHGGQMVLSDSDLSPVEGKAEGGLVVIQFPSLKDAEAFYHSPEYAPVKELRIKATTGGFLALTSGLTIQA